MQKLLLLAASLLVMAPSVSALPNDLFGNPADSGLWDRGLVVGLGVGGFGLAALVGTLYYLGVGGLRHVHKENVLEHPMRQSLLDVVVGHPGVHLRELASRHGTAVTNTQWHLRKLEMAGLVKTQKVQGRRLYYPVAGGTATRDRALQNAALQNPNAEKLGAYLESHAGCNQRHLADALGMNPGTVRWHLRRLETSGLVRSIQEGTQTRYFLMKPTDRPPRPLRVEIMATPLMPVEEEARQNS